MYRIQVRSGAGEILSQGEGMGDARLIHGAEYQPGDRIVFLSDQPHAWVQVDQAVMAAPVYLPECTFAFDIPFGDGRNGYAPQAFSGALHALSIGPAMPSLLAARRNIALNPMDQRMPSGCFPHATANVETRGEAQFWARNAIDGHRFNAKHGKWPFHSWGIGERRDAWLRFDFGREVWADAVGLVLRADFPHDAWWERGTLTCSDGHALDLPLTKTSEVQVFPMGLRKISWVMLSHLVKAEDPSPFPALTQLEVYGFDGGI